MEYTIHQNTLYGRESLQYLANMIEGQLGVSHPESIRVREVIASWTDEPLMAQTPEKAPAPAAQNAPAEASARKRRR